MTRTFIAIEMNAPTTRYLQQLVQQLGAELPGIRFVDPATWHVTLAFLGELDDGRLAKAEEAVHVAASQAAPLSLRAAGIGFFGPPAQPRVIWAGLAGDLVALGQLQFGVVEAIRAAGLSCDERFTPHITLARPKQAIGTAGAAALVRMRQATLSGPEIAVSAIAIMRSDLAPDGAHYTRLADVPLGSPSPCGPRTV